MHHNTPPQKTNTTGNTKEKKYNPWNDEEHQTYPKKTYIVFQLYK